jgi:hypothetical protein
MTYVPTPTWEPFDFLSMTSGGGGSYAAIYQPITPTMSTSGYNDDVIVSAEAQHSTMVNVLVLESVAFFAYMLFWFLRM